MRYERCGWASSTYAEEIRSISKASEDKLAIQAVEIRQTMKQGKLSWKINIL